MYIKYLLKAYKKWTTKYNEHKYCFNHSFKLEFSSKIKQGFLEK